MVAYIHELDLFSFAFGTSTILNKFAEGTGTWHYYFLYFSHFVVNCFRLCVWKKLKQMLSALGRTTCNGKDLWSKAKFFPNCKPFVLRRKAVFRFRNKTCFWWNNSFHLLHCHSWWQNRRLLLWRQKPENVDISHYWPASDDLTGSVTWLHQTLSASLTVAYFLANIGSLWWEMRTISSRILNYIMLSIQVSGYCFRKVSKLELKYYNSYAKTDCPLLVFPFGSSRHECTNFQQNLRLEK